MRRNLLRSALLASVLAPSTLLAATYTVGPSGRQYTQLAALFNDSGVTLRAGDIVEVDGNATYQGDVIIRNRHQGTAANPIVVRWRRQGGGSRPVLQGGTNTLKFQQSNHVVLEGFEVRGGANTCLFNEAHGTVVRDVIVRDCPRHGILGADNNSGSFTLEYSEVANSGSGNFAHSIYMQSDEVAYPGAVFLMRYNYVHSGNGGQLLKTRHERSLIYYNWFEGAAQQEMELIGPDCETQQNGWNANLRREDTDIVGNVIVHTSSWTNAIRMGGDLNGRSQGRVRMVNNTVLFNRSGQANVVLVQLGAESLEMHNNVIYQAASGAAPAIVRENPASNVETPYCGPQGKEPWSSGRKVAGSNNWVQSSAAQVPAEWNGTIRGANPDLANIAQRNLRPQAGSPLIGAGGNSPASPSGFPFPGPLLVPAFDPPQRAKLALNAAVTRSRPQSNISIGAFEPTGGAGPGPDPDPDPDPGPGPDPDPDPDPGPGPGPGPDPGPSTPVRMHGAQPLVPPRAAAARAPAVPARAATRQAPAASSTVIKRKKLVRRAQTPYGVREPGAYEPMR